MFQKADECKTITEVVQRNTRISIDQFLNPEVHPYLHGLQDALQCIKEHRTEPITVVGDYDVDGVCATAIMVQGLRKFTGKEIKYRLPKRFSEGYGLSTKIIDEIDEGVVITVDNGIAAVDAIKKAKEKGLTVIVTDHHLPVRDAEEKVVLPIADVLVDPNAEEKSSYKYYCGAAIAYRLVRELNEGQENPDLLVLASIATVADVMDLTGANRILVKTGLDAINQGHGVPGLRALLEQIQLTTHITEEDYGFKIGPIINASGRLYDEGAERVLRVLLADQVNQKEVQDLIEANNVRKEKVAQAMPIAERLIRNKPIVIYHPSFGEGIIGLIAGNLQEKYHCPVIVFTKTANGNLKGSGRSVPGVHLKKALDHIQDTMIGYGGHEGAAGILIAAGALNTFSDAFAREIEHWTPEEINLDRYDLDLTRKNLKNICEELKVYAPFGQGNPRPVLRIPFHAERESYRRIGDGSHFILRGKTMSIMGFSMASRYEEAGFPKDIWCIGYLKEHWFNEHCYLQFDLLDFEARNEE